MKIDGSYTFDAPYEEVWEALLDPEVLSRALPGGHDLEKVGPNQYKAKMKIKVGPVQGLFSGTVNLSDIVEFESYHLEVEGKGAPGFVKGNGDLKLQANGDKTILLYNGDAHVGGRLASVGQRLMDSSTQALIRQSLESLDAQIVARVEGVPGGEPPPAKAPSELQFAAGVTRKMIEDYVAEEQGQRAIKGGLIALGALLFLRIVAGWWAGLLARKIAEELDKRR